MKLNTGALYEALEWCGCCDDDVTEAFQKVLDCFTVDNPKGYMYYDEIAEKTGLNITLVQVILCCFDKLNVTEHGSSVRGSWLHDPERCEPLLKLCRPLEDDEDEAEGTESQEGDLF